MEKVQILMSTYNGEKYLEEQLDSILMQDYPEIYLLVRDDGSTDRTMDIIKRYAERNDRVAYYQGDNIGVVNSFFDLLRNADPTMDYYSFSDQDDVWKVDKISRGIDILNKTNHLPLLYCCDTILVNDKLQPLEQRITKVKKKPGFGNSLVENICTGCTCIINRRLREIVVRELPRYVVMHDWWLYLCASRFGKVIYDEKGYIFYRQHTGNVIGTRNNYLDEFKFRIKNYKKNRGQLVRQVMEFKRIFEVKSEEDELLNWIIWSKKKPIYRIKIFFTNRIYRQRRMDNIIFRMLFLFGKI